MATDNQDNQPLEERRSESHKLIKELIDTRTQLLALYSRLAGSKPFGDEIDDDLAELLDEFCETLIDYTADAHFRLYRFIDENKEKRKAILDLAEQIYPRILQSTQTILDFNDRYFQDNTEDSQGNRKRFATLEADLSNLGEQMAERIELEDRLIKVMISSRQQRTTEPV